MKRPVAIGALLAAFAVGIVCGIAIHRCKVVRAKAERRAAAALEDNRWSVGIYEGRTPFDLSPAEGVRNPVLAGEDVVDIDASFVADPFMVLKDGKRYIFFEAMNRESGHGDIGYAESRDGKDWQYGRIAIDEPFHLSYPYVFEWDGDYYMIPASNEDLSVRLYKAASFPDRWEYLGNLLAGFRYVDPSIFRYDDRWWLFVATPGCDVLNLYYSSRLLDGWRPHRSNPIVRFDKHIARPAGRVIVHDNRVYRLAQDDEPSYGRQVFAFEITELSETVYAEEIVSKQPVVGMTGNGWNAAGMHHVDLHKVGDKWIAAVDGRSR